MKSITPKERSSLAASFPILQNSEKFDSVEFWGKIEGIEKDYLIAQASNGLLNQKYFYSLDGLTWLQMPKVKEQVKKKARDMLQRFKGDPAFEIVGVSEEERLAAVVEIISEETRVIPRGAYFKGAEKELKANPYFQGLQPEFADNFDQYYHLTPIDAKEHIQRGDFVETIDVFKSIQKDAKRGLWSIRKEKGGRQIEIKNNEWPGSLASHQVNADKFGNVYFGTGQRNVDLQFVV